MLVRADSDLVNDEQLRVVFFQLLRDKANEVNADTVIFSLDVYEHNQTPEQVKEEEDYIKLNQGERIPVEMRKALNLSETRDAIMVLVETDITSFQIMQYYHLEDGKVIFEDEKVTTLSPMIGIFPCEVKSAH